MALPGERNEVILRTVSSTKGRCVVLLQMLCLPKNRRAGELTLILVTMLQRQSTGASYRA